MDRLDHLRSFLRVAELGSFTAAAEQLGLPKASVSLAVQRLEAEVGVQLLHRTTRRVRLSADGEQFRQRARDLLDDMEDLQGMFRRDTGQLKGRLRVDMSSGLARQLVIPRLPDFLDRHPGLEIELSGTDRRVDLVREGFDCVLRVGPLDDNTLVARPLGVMHIVNCASPAYLAARGVPHTVADLTTHALVHYVGTLGQRSPGFEYHDGQAYRSLPMGGAITVNSGEAYSAAALAGLGILFYIRHRASLGGIGILAVYLQRTRGWSAGKVQMSFDTLLMGVAFFVLSPDKVMYSAIGAVVLSLVLMFNHRPGRYMGV